MNYNLPLVSIVLCTYNGERYIIEQINSLMQQTYPNLELIVCDDNSNDNTLSLVKDRLAQSNIEHTIVCNEKRLGYIDNFNKGIGMASGDFIALCDQDDIWDHSKIEILVDEIGDCSLIYSDSQLIDDYGNVTGERLSRHFNMASGHDARKLLLNNSVSAHALLFKKELCSRILPLPDLIFHDWWIAFVAMASGGIKYLDIPLVYYRIHQSNATSIKKVVEGMPKKKGKKTRKWDAFKNMEKQLALVDLMITRAGGSEELNNFLITFKNLTSQRRYQIFSPKYFMFWLKYYKILFFCRITSRTKQLRFVSRTCFGLWFKYMHYKFNNKI